MKKILIIGIGAGDPDFVTMQAAKALNAVAVFLIAGRLGDVAEEIIAFASPSGSRMAGSWTLV